MDNISKIVWFIIVMAFFFVFGVMIGDQLELLKKCRKDNNVYECKLIAVPVQTIGQSDADN